MSGLQGHTPGPHTVEHERGAYVVRYGPEGNNAVACRLNYAHGVQADRERAKADAHLFASAPAMRAALTAKDARIAELDGLEREVRILANQGGPGSLSFDLQWAKVRALLTRSPKARETEESSS